MHRLRWHLRTMLWRKGSWGKRAESAKTEPASHLYSSIVLFKCEGSHEGIGPDSLVQQMSVKLWSSTRKHLPNDTIHETSTAGRRRVCPAAEAQRRQGKSVTGRRHWISESQKPLVWWEIGKVKGVVLGDSMYLLCTLIYQAFESDVLEGHEKVENACTNQKCFTLKVKNGKENTFAPMSSGKPHGDLYQSKSKRSSKKNMNNISTTKANKDAFHNKSDDNDTNN